MRLIAFCLCLFLPAAAAAQQQDSVFDSYEEYAAFVDSRVMSRNFVELIQVLGGRDEYTAEQLRGSDQRFKSIYPTDFTRATLAKVVDMGGGFRQEMRIYWNDRNSYVYFFAFLHNQGDKLIVIKFTLNSNVNEILSQF